MSGEISPGARGRRESARQSDGKFGAQARAEADVQLPPPGYVRSLTALAQQWEKHLDSGQVPQELLESLDIPMVRDITAAIASSDDPGNAARAISGTETMGRLPRGSGALSGRMARQADAEWVQDVLVGDGVRPGERLRTLEAATADRQDLEPEAASGAALLNGWTRWQLGDIAGARGTLAAEVDQNPGNELAGLLLQVMDLKRRRGA